MSRQFPNPDLNKKIEEWMRWDKNDKTLSELSRMINDNDVDNLCKLLLNRLSFGTAGLRGKMGAGYNAMNDLVIVQTAQGLLKYLEENDSDYLKKNGIVFGFDGRYNSKRFAELSASIFLHKNYKVYLFNDVIATPLLAYTVKYHNCVAGVMVTASHNPKDDNGYKVYWKNGAQIISPADKEIQKKIMENLEPWPNSWDTSILQKSELLRNPMDEIVTSYVRNITSKINDRSVIERTNLEFTYTAMHGVGYKFVKKVFDSVGLKLVAVEEQKDPDPEFKTVVFPNPEEGKSCLNLSMNLAEKIGSNIIIANDPDADRLAVAEKNRENGTWIIFNGNELGALLGWWILENNKKLNNNLKNCFMMSSTVSSKILKTMSKSEGFNFEETLTGFKWMGNRAFELEKENKQTLFAFEEAIGFMCDTHVLDKDGISAALHLAVLASALYENGKTLQKKLEEIYEKYGYHVSDNSYFICHDPEVIRRIFERLRNYDGVNTYPKSILNGKYEIINVRDLTTGYDSEQPDSKAILPVSKSSQMITFSFKNGLVATLRTSGTEPKIKYYTELCASTDQKDKTVVKETLDEMVTAIVAEFLQPEKNKLTPRTM